MIDNTSKNEDQKIEYDQKLYNAVHGLRNKFYTYKDLCIALDQGSVGGNQKKRHIKELERYMCLEYNKKTKKYKIVEKYDTPLPPYPEEPSNTVYAKHVKTLLLNYLLREHERNPGVIYISSERLYRALGMINGRYIEYKRSDKKKLKDELMVELVINKEYSADTLHEGTIKYYIDDFYSRSGSKISSLLKGALDTLEKQGYLTYSKAYKIYRYGKNPAHSTDAEIEDIMEIERTVMDELGFESDKDIWFGGQTREYWNRVLELVQEIDPDIYGLYRCHKIIGSKKNIQKALSREEESEEMCELNHKILNFIDLQAEKNIHKSFNKNPYDYTKQLSDRYVYAQRYLSDRLIKIKDVAQKSLYELCEEKYEEEKQEGDPDWF